MTATPTPLSSAIYSGQVRHRRFHPKTHEFQYSVFMVYLDTLEIETIFSQSPLWSISRWAPVRFNRRDFHIDREHQDKKNLPDVDSSVRATLASTLGYWPTGPIRMLVNLRYWGFTINPLSTYYCFDDDGTTLIGLIAEVHNTPWNERHAYVLIPENNETHKQHLCFPKVFHVSPFNPIDMEYQWHSTTPDQTLAIHIENWQGDKKIMDATMALKREPLNRISMHWILIRFPWVTVKTASAIYWQALKLWWKGVPFFAHPASGEPIKTNKRHEESIP